MVSFLEHLPKRRKGAKCELTSFSVSSFPFTFVRSPPALFGLGFGYVEIGSVTPLPQVRPSPLPQNISARFSTMSSSPFLLPPSVLLPSLFAPPSFNLHPHSHRKETPNPASSASSKTEPASTAMVSTPTVTLPFFKTSKPDSPPSTNTTKLSSQPTTILPTLSLLKT